MVLDQYKAGYIHKILCAINYPLMSFLGEGFGNSNWLIKNNGQDFVIRIKKNKERQFMDSLEKEHSFLRYCEFKGIDFVPKSVYYDKEHNYIIESFLEGRKVTHDSFSKAQIELFVDQIYSISQLDTDEYLRFCRRNKLKSIKQVMPLDSLMKYGFNRFKEAKEGDIDKQVIRWIDERLDQNLKAIKSSRDYDNLGFVYGDIQPEVIIDDKGKMKFYDFEHISITQKINIAYIKVHGRFDSTQFDYLIDVYSKHFNKEKEWLIEKIIKDEKIIRVNDVVWAAMKWAVTKEERFKELTYKRIELADEIIGKN